MGHHPSNGHGPIPNALLDLGRLPGLHLCPGLDLDDSQHPYEPQKGGRLSCRPGCDKHVHSPEALIKNWANALVSNQHVVWGSFGEPGSGKSEGQILLSIQLMDRLIAMGYLKPGTTFNVRRQVAFKPLDRKKLAQASGTRFLPFLDDEATGEGGHKHQTLSSKNVENAQDLDACRGRNQANGFAAPTMKRLASPVVDHLMGYLEWHKDHSVEWFDAIRGGGQWDPYVYWDSRFTVEKTPWLQELYPAIGKEYLTAKGRHMRGETLEAESILLEDRFASVISRVLT